MPDNIFAPVNRMQEKTANCGPTSMSYCLFTLFGDDVAQAAIARSLYSGPKKWYKEVCSGFDQIELKKIASKFKAKAEFNQVPGGKANFERFNIKLVAHLKAGNPAMLSIYDGGHWVAILGYKEANGKATYYVNDPNETGDEVFDQWSKTDLKEEFDEDHGEDDYFAIMLSRKDGKKPVFPFSKDMRNLLDEGSYDTLSEMIKDLKKIAKIASVDSKADSYLSDHLLRHKKTILGVIKNLIDWEVTESNFDEVTCFYNDYITVARASRMRMSSNVQLVLFTAYMTSLLTTCAWWGEL